MLIFTQLLSVATATASSSRLTYLASYLYEYHADLCKAIDRFMPFGGHLLTTMPFGIL